jgi:hypothetical protein
LFDFGAQKAGLAGENATVQFNTFPGVASTLINLYQLRDLPFDIFLGGFRQRPSQSRMFKIGSTCPKPVPVYRYMIRPSPKAEMAIPVSQMRRFPRVLPPDTRGIFRDIITDDDRKLAAGHRSIFP